MANSSDPVWRSTLDRILVAWQYPLPQHLISRFMYWFTRLEYPPVKNRFIDWFIARFNVDMRQAIEENPHAYACFNAFFTRALKPEIRPVVNGAGEIACPVDGTVSQIGKIVENRVFQAKGRYFSLEALLGGSRELANKFRNGQFATIYLSPRDYHRVHMPLRGDLKKMIHVPGRLFSVNPLTTRAVRHLFARNERVVCQFDTSAGPMAIILVGAICVASIETVWAGEVTPYRPRGRTREWAYTDRPIPLERGDEMGRFNMGSTAIVLFGPECIQWETVLRENSAVKTGQLIGAVTRPLNTGG